MRLTIAHGNPYSRQDLSGCAAAALRLLRLVYPGFVLKLSPALHLGGGSAQRGNWRYFLVCVKRLGARHGVQLALVWHTQSTDAERHAPFGFGMCLHCGVG